MKVDEIKEIAKRQNIKAGRVTKNELVRTIQLAEGNPPCFKNDNSGQCEQHICLWREDCV